jgi:lipopolysaccharide/colanic/teichoic acid biosynthesis glycosyltransferase
MKRIFDIITSITLIILLTPFAIVIALIIALESRGGVFFTQDRGGINGRAFKIFKFRTMIPGAENKGPLLTVRNDPRVTKVGSFLRRWSLDELPQLFNIIKGDMSLVGPRPEILPIVKNYTEWQRLVFLVKPGLSGFSQVMGRDDLSIETKLRLDIYYIRHHSFCFDMWIIWKTVVIVLTGKGAF